MRKESIKRYYCEAGPDITSADRKKVQSTYNFCGIVPGQLVTSKAGRDKGCVYVVLKVGPEGIDVVDGRLKTVEKPKFKNFKHVQKISYYMTVIDGRVSVSKAAGYANAAVACGKVQSGSTPEFTNDNIRRFIKLYTSICQNKKESGGEPQ